MLRQPIDILILALGANDGLRGVSVSTSLENLQKIIDKTKAKNPSVKLVIAGMKVPPNMGGEYGRQFEEMFQKIAESNQAVLIPFLLEGVGGRPELNLEDGIHPTEGRAPNDGRHGLALLGTLAEIEALRRKMCLLQFHR